MDRRRVFREFLFNVALVSSGISSVAAGQQQPNRPTYDLTNRQRPGDLWKVAAELVVDGDVILPQQSKNRTLPLHVAAQLKYEEMLLAVGPSSRSARFYQDATAVIDVGENQVEHTLRSTRRLLVADRETDHPTIYSPKGPLTREELDLVDVLGNSLVWVDLLPTRRVAVGDRWNPSQESCAMLLQLDGVAHADIQSRLERVEKNMATIIVEGTAHGSAEGVPTEIELFGEARFDLQRGRITWLQMQIKENRSPSLNGPGLKVAAHLTYVLEPISKSKQLRVERLSAISEHVSPALIRLVHRAPQMGLRVTCERQWFVVEDQKNLWVLRLVEGNELVTQCNISRLTDKSTAEVRSLAEFQQDIRRSLGNHFGRLLAASELKNSSHERVYRVVVHGEADGLPIEWRYYLIHEETGHQVALAFSLESGKAKLLGQRDRRLVQTVEWIDVAEPAVTAGSDRKQIQR